MAELNLPSEQEGYFALDINNNIPFLVDSGASRSVLPLSLLGQAGATVVQGKQIRLKSVTGDPLKVFGAAELQLKFNRQQTVSQNYL